MLTDVSLCFHPNSLNSQAFQFFVPIGAGAGLHLPSSMFVGQSGDKRASPDFSADEQLACRWKKVGSKVEAEEEQTALLSLPD